MKSKEKNIFLILGLCLVLEVGSLFFNSGIVKGLSKRADNLKAYAAALREDASILPGDILDRNGTVLVETAKKAVRQTEYIHGTAYSQILGYTGNRLLYPAAENRDDVVGSRNDYRLMAFLADDNWNGSLYKTVDQSGTKGQSAVLTIDHELQMKVYQALKNQMSTEEMGSAVVIDAKTGEILSMVSFPAYDFSDLGSAKQKMLADGKATKLEPWHPVSYKNPEAPGSIFKVLTAVALLDHGHEDYTVKDQSFEVDGWRCSNAYTSWGNTIDYHTAIKKSSNVFFASGALLLGKDAMKETAAKFMLSDQGYLELDFGNVPYNWNLEVDRNVLAQTGFGQGKTELTTVHAAMITQAIANDGVMMKPYMVKELVNANGEMVYTGESQVYSTATTKDTADKITAAMREAAKYTAGHYRGLGKTASVFEKYQVCGKTGTAEVGDVDRTNNAWFISFAPAEDPEYVVVVNQCRTKKAGYKMTTTVADVYEYLFESYKGE